MDTKLSYALKTRFFFFFLNGHVLSTPQAGESIEHQNNLTHKSHSHTHTRTHTQYHLHFYDPERIRKLVYSRRN